MQPHFDYACSVWHPNLSNRLLLLSLLLLLLVVVVVAVVVVLLIYLLLTAFTKKKQANKSQNYKYSKTNAFASV